MTPEIAACKLLETLLTLYIHFLGYFFFSLALQLLRYISLVCGRHTLYGHQPYRLKSRKSFIATARELEIKSFLYLCVHLIFDVIKYFFKKNSKIYLKTPWFEWDLNSGLQLRSPTPSQVATNAGSGTDIRTSLVPRPELWRRKTPHHSWTMEL